MSLKPDRQIDKWRLEYHMSSSGYKGGVVSLVSAGSGVAMDSSSNVVAHAANPSGAVVVGVLLDDVVAANSLIKRNPYKEEVEFGNKVSIASEGWVVTDKIYSGSTPSAGATAYLGANGEFTTTQAAGAPVVGRFETSKDEDGFAKVSVQVL